MNNRTIRTPILAVAILVVLLLPVVTAYAAADPFLGTWTSTDIDGSFQRLSIGAGPGGAYRFAYRDFGASACGIDSDGNILYAARAGGTGQLSGATVAGEFQVYCLAKPTYFLGTFAVAFTYNAGTDTLTDGFGVVWHRQ